MTPDQIQFIRQAKGYSYRQLARILNINESTIRKAAQGQYILGGAAERIMEMLDRDELPARYTEQSGS
jgi:DNA-binding transcriptional regulator YiaG